MGLLLPCKSAEWAKDTHLISLGVTRVSAKPAAEKGTAEERNRPVRGGRGDTWLRRLLPAAVQAILQEPPPPFKAANLTRLVPTSPPSKTPLFPQNRVRALALPSQVLPASLAVTLTFRAPATLLLGEMSPQSGAGTLTRQPQPPLSALRSQQRLCPVWEAFLALPTACQWM